jgi:hypothetical protein
VGVRSEQSETETSLTWATCLIAAVTAVPGNLSMYKYKYTTRLFVC